jgi:hypothetical protein
MFSLPYDIQYSIWKAYFSTHVLGELAASVANPSRSRCPSCCVHGFPCRLCSIVRHNGAEGPGRIRGLRFLFHDMSLPHEVDANMLAWMLLNDATDHVNVTSVQRFINPF